MKWNEITVFTSEEGIDAVCGRFDILGVTQLMIVQGREEIAAFLNDTAKYWDFADMDALSAAEPCVKAYIEDNDENRAFVDEIRASFAALKSEDTGIDMGSLGVIVRLVDDEDWANSWKANYKPFNVGDRLLIRPSWEDDYDAGNRKVISLDPGMAFGTGTHQTTRMCLEAIEKTDTRGVDVLDLGCGSGILAIAALLLGARHAVCVDIDPIAQNIVRENASMNGIGEADCEILIGDALTDESLVEYISQRKYGLVAVNIVASVVIGLMPLIKKVVTDDGTVVCSGIIGERLDEVLDALKQNGFEVTGVNADEDWRQISAKPL